MLQISHHPTTFLVKCSLCVQMLQNWELWEKINRDAIEGELSKELRGQRTTEGGGWQGLLETIGSARAGCPGPHPVRYWTSPQMAASKDCGKSAPVFHQPHCTKEKKNCFPLRLHGTSFISICAHFFSSSHWIPLGRIWLSTFAPLCRYHIIPALNILQLQDEQSQLSQPPLVCPRLHSTSTALYWTPSTAFTPPCTGELSTAPSTPDVPHQCQGERKEPLPTWGLVQSPELLKNYWQWPCSDTSQLPLVQHLITAHEPSYSHFVHIFPKTASQKLRKKPNHHFSLLLGICDHIPIQHQAHILYNPSTESFM